LESAVQLAWIVVFGRAKQRDDAGQGVGPVGGIVDPNDLGDNQRVVQSQVLLLLVERALEQLGADQVLLVGLDAVLDLRVEAPVLVDAVLKLDDGEEADARGQGLVEVDGLERVGVGSVSQRSPPRPGRLLEHGLSGSAKAYLQRRVVARVLLPRRELLARGLPLGKVMGGGGL